LGKPIILFSATPYRNDLRLFDVDYNFVAELSFKDAVKHRTIRNVEVATLPSSKSAQQFAKALCKRILELRALGSLNDDVKIIVRCGTQSSVDAVYNSILAEQLGKQFGAIAFHENFRAGPTRISEVPDLKTRDERFLVHQYKLMEGLDDPRIQVLAIFDPFSNARQLVQQVGRIVRNPGRRASTAFVVCSENDKHTERAWAGFRKYDAVLESIPKGDRQIMERVLEALPPVDYFLGRFRERVPVAFSTPLEDEILVKKSCIVLEGVMDDGSDASLEDVLVVVRENLVTAGRWIARDVPDNLPADLGVGQVIIAASVAPSPLLPESAFVDIKLTATVVRKVGSFIFVSDSEGSALVDRSAAFAQPSQSKLHQLIAGPLSRVTAMAAANTDIGTRALRSRMATAFNLLESAPYLADHQYVLTRVTGYSGKGERRVIGFAKRRVASGKGELVNVSTFGRWTVALAHELLGRTTPNQFFPRFAEAIQPPSVANAEPRHILLDLEAIHERFVHPTLANGVDQLVDLASDVRPRAAQERGSDATHEFDVVLADESLQTVGLSYSSAKSRYEIDSQFLSTFHSQDRPNETLVAKINTEQAFRIIPRMPNAVYVGGDFFSNELGLDPGGRGRLLLDLLHGTPALNTATSEKGAFVSAGVKRFWPTGSVFSVIDKGLRGLQYNKPFLGNVFGFLACTDLGREMADFVAVDAKRSCIALIHAKAARNRHRFSVSALQEVVGQATKNLSHVQANAATLGMGLSRIHQSWELKGATLRRVRAGKAAEFIPAATAVASDPQGSREVWLVLGNILSKQAAEVELSSDDPSPALVQMFMLLSSFYTNCLTVGARARVFCSE
jgi:hypothetical protein